jgi:hypothetical protein
MREAEAHRRWAETHRRRAEELALEARALRDRPGAAGRRIADLAAAEGACPSQGAPAPAVSVPRGRAAGSARMRCVCRACDRGPSAAGKSAGAHGGAGPQATLRA